MKKRPISINIILLTVSMVMSIIMASGLYFLIQGFLSSNISVIEKHIQYNEIQYWVHYIEKTYQYTMDNLSSIQNENELVNDIILYENNESMVTKVRYKEIISSKVASITRRFEGSAGITIVTSNGNQIFHSGLMISSEHLASIIERGRRNEVSLFSSTITDDGFLLSTGYEYKYVTVNLFHDSEFIATVLVFLKDNNFWGELYSSTRFLITDESGGEILNTFGGAYNQFDKNDLNTVILSNGWSLEIGAEKTYLHSINRTLLASLGTSILFFMILSFGISLFLFRRPFSGVGKLKEFIDNYTPVHRRHERLKTKQSNIRQRLIGYFGLSVIIPSLILFGVFSVWYNRQIENMIIEKYSNMVNTAANTINKVIERKKAVFVSLLYDYDFQTYIFNREQFLEHHNESYIKEMLYKYAELDLKGYDITVYDNQDRLLYSNSNFINSSTTADDTLIEDLYTHSSNEFGQIALSISLDFGDFYYENVRYHYRGKMDIPLSDLYGYYRNLNDANSQVCIVDDSGAVISSGMEDGRRYDPDFPDSQGVRKNNFENEIIFYSRLGDTPWYLTMAYDFNFLTSEVRNYISSFISILAIIILLTIIIITYLAGVIRKPLLRLSAALRDYNAFGDTEYVQATSNIKEVADMTEQFNDLLDRIDELYDELILSANEKNQVLTRMHKAELTALQSQINPHFLSNTLENLISLIHNGQKEKAIDVINLISTQFRVGISRKNKTITLREEIIYTKAYIEIIKIRFDEGIHFLWNVGEDLLDCQILKLVLQPLVENAVKHGLGGRETPDGRVVIDAGKVGGDIVITVSDNGRGIAGDQLAAIERRLNDNDHFEDHIGLFNVHWRLRLVYGGEYGLTVSSIVGVGTQVRMVFPRSRQIPPCPRPRISRSIFTQSK